MGTFVYGSQTAAVEFDDRTLAHLKVVIATKLRRSEGFMFTWEYSTESESGHSSVWLHPSIPIQFDFLGNREPSLNREWLEELSRIANNTGTLRIVPEPLSVQASSTDLRDTGELVGARHR